MGVADHIVKTPTEYMQVKRMGKESIPDGEDPDNWITLRDKKTGQKLYAKVPQFKKKTDFEYEMRNKMNSDRPSLPLKIVKLRVINQSEIQDIRAE